MISSFDAIVRGGGSVQLAAQIGWVSGSDPIKCTFFVDGGVVLDQQCGVSPSYTLNVAAGSHSFQLRICNRFGTCTTSPNVTRTIETPPPPAPVISSFDAIVRGGGSVQLAAQIGWVSGSDPIKCTFFVDGGVVLDQQCGVSPSYTLNVAAGSHSFQLRICNRFGTCTTSPNVTRQI